MYVKNRLRQKPVLSLSLSQEAVKLLDLIPAGKRSVVVDRLILSASGHDIIAAYTEPSHHNPKRSLTPDLSPCIAVMGEGGEAA